MNTADISVLSDELAVSLNPLRRGAQRARALCAKVAGLALPWNASSAGTAPRHRARPGSTPARWPFPPAPPEDGLLGEAAIPVAMPAPAVRPEVPAVPLSPSLPVTPAAREFGLGNATVEPVAAQLTRKAMLIDVAMVLAWGAIIPGLMWLGAAAGF
ncbi:hypothetical protein [Achromobacter denitrificans]|uniref:hypothetical protein n=1 Tax=Achromobacter denitrificans TaxID=32002 RepID=UPI0014675D3C|nr:hypothetical protein [Achromobacter denitrificans]CAB3896033.1 hypothetical protein LMG1860_05090 [Achromobacter denitrificans]